MKTLKLKGQWFTHLMFIIFSAITIFPLVLIFVVSITDEKTLTLNGYSFFPEKINFAAYTYLFHDSSTILNAYGVTILVTVVGTTLSLLFTSLFAYPISRSDFPFRKWLTFYVFFTLLFNGGTVPWYLVYSKYLGITDTIFALIVPNLLVNALYVLIMRTFFTTTIPPGLIESAQIDGAGETRIYAQIILRLSLPVLATIGLFNTLAYWNDWWNSLIFISETRLFSLQYLLNKILVDIQVILNSPGNTSQTRLLADIPTETVRMAMAMIGLGPIIIAYPFFQRFLIQGLTIGAIKG
ncbi:carbohydrate ABC transporter permease [Paenibacillus psychroresistens]|uniref:Carbohydrate ABC transporter permease n=1 Tax=Paenibacillus psychroresistens TaxID=1778678 RepID=A0A6B8RPA8_9BACL|nr:carbohydrate ABC transporter permease [Paenibacillus psychroresistens]QGQ97158.1 carbohydrate ABC transporter permease [Paenibacillus psychroresistens]